MQVIHLSVGAGHPDKQASKGIHRHFSIDLLKAARISPNSDISHTIVQDLNLFLNDVGSKH